MTWQVAEGAIKVCTGAMLYNDPENITLTTLKRIFTEMAGLFPDQVFSMGGDEPYIIGNCTLESVVAMEQELARCVTTTTGGAQESTPPLFSLFCLAFLASVPSLSRQTFNFDCYAAQKDVSAPASVAGAS